MVAKDIPIVHQVGRQCEHRTFILSISRVLLLKERVLKTFQLQFYKIDNKEIRVLFPKV